MRALSLDYRQRKTGHWTGIALLILVLAGIGWLIYYYREISNEAIHLESLISRIERKLHPSQMVVPVTAAESQQRATEVKNANDVLLRLSLPWDRLFESVEAANNDNVALLGVDPDSKKGSIKISGEAKDFAAMLGYIRALQASKFFTEVYLQQHQVQEKDPDKPIHFILDASWTGKH